MGKIIEVWGRTENGYKQKLFTITDNGIVRYEDGSGIYVQDEGPHNSANVNRTVGFNLEELGEECRRIEIVFRADRKEPEEIS